MKIVQLPCPMFLHAYFRGLSNRLPYVMADPGGPDTPWAFPALTATFFPR
jgi:hypothetical protein